MRLAVSLRSATSLTGVFTAAAVVASCATQAPGTTGRATGPSSQFSVGTSDEVTMVFAIAVAATSAAPPENADSVRSPLGSDLTMDA